MKFNNTLRSKGAALILGVSLLMSTLPAAAIDLVAVESIWLAPGGGNTVRMWSYIFDPGGSCINLPVLPKWVPGPTLKGNTNGSVSIKLRNCISEPVSIVIPGQNTTLSPVSFTPDGDTRPRVRSFTQEVPADNGASSVTYTWDNLNEGTFLYQSGTHPGKQVHMGLFGPMTVGINSSANSDVVLLFSEIDPALHVNADAATPLNYKPKYYLVNATSALPEVAPPKTKVGGADKTIQLRFINAGYMSHIPTIHGEYMSLIAEDGHYYPYPKEQYSVLLPPGKTIDALWSPTKATNYILYDRKLSMTHLNKPGGGMTQKLSTGSLFPWHLLVPSINLETE